MSKSITQIKLEMEKGMKLIQEMDKIFERWASIKDYPNYKISTFGRVKNSITGKILKPQINTVGYYKVNLYKNKEQRTFSIHQLVANTFLNNLENKKCIDHKDNDKLNNNITNLRFATHTENTRNKSIMSNNTSGATGVTYDKRYNKWQAKIQFNARNNSLGYYFTKEEAITARHKKAVEYFGEFVHKDEKV